MVQLPEGEAGDKSGPVEGNAALRQIVTAGGVGGICVGVASQQTHGTSASINPGSWGVFRFHDALGRFAEQSADALGLNERAAANLYDLQFAFADELVNRSDAQPGGLLRPLDRCGNRFHFQPFARHREEPR